MDLRLGPRRAMWAAGILLTLFCSGCGGDEFASREVVFFAAASTGDAVKAVAAEFAKDHRVEVHWNFASSATLAQQITAGAEADLFLSAHPEWIDLLQKEHRVEQRTDFLGNSLAIVVPRKVKAEAFSPGDLASPAFKLIAIGEPDSVPAGTYARTALQRLGLWEVLRPKLLFGLDVRQVLAYVDSGEVDAGFVYATDAAISEGLTVASRLGPDLTGEIRYPLVLLSGHSTDAADFFQFMLSGRSAEVFRSFGFEVFTNP